MLRLVMGAFVSSSDDEEDEEEDQQEKVPHGDSEELVDKTESELRTITLKPEPVDRQNLNGKMLKLASKR